MAEQVKTATKTQLRIRWDGDAPGIAEHRLSLSSFGVPLELLLAALKRIATQMVKAALDSEKPRVGRFADLARSLDIELVNIEGNSTGFDAVVSFTHPPDMLPLFMDLPERATIELLDSIDDERKGIARHGAVRNYLHSLPDGIHKQMYELHDNGVTKKKVEFGDIDFIELPIDLPMLVEIQGDVVGVGFDPGRNEVRVKPESGSVSSFSSTAEDVDTALRLRHEKIRTLAIREETRAKLLSLRRASEPRFQRDVASVDEHIFKKWNGLLRRLSR